jgi:hypothetical protein
VGVLGLGLWGSVLSAWTTLGTNISGWQGANNLIIYYDPSNCTISQATLEAALETALQAWNGIPTSNLKLSKQQVSNPISVATFIAGNAGQVPLILCDTNFSSTNSTDGNYVPAATRTGNQINPLSYGGIELNAESGKSANISNFSSDQLAVILGHELGHVLGLGHSSSVNAVMYYSLQNKTQVVLTQDDRDGISYLYPRNEFKGGAFGCGSVHQREFLNSKDYPLIGFFAIWMGLVVLITRKVIKLEPLL